ncbi:MAG: VWA domain-containing protein, partial [Thermoplasmata archaeon]|nr:VWA domain-containing protein [Thermoplasmata archaeon]
MKNYPKGRNWGCKTLALVTIINLVLTGLVFAADEGDNVSQRARAPGIISIDPDREEWAYPDNTISLNLTVTNINSGINDYIDLDYYCEPNGWPVQLLKGDGTYQPLTNNGGTPTLVDVGPINNAQAVDITVNVTIPLQPVWDFEYINLTAQSTNNPAGFDNATLRINIYPYLLVRKTLDPPIIYLKDTETGAPNETTVLLELKGSGMPWEEFKPQDTVFIIDSSGSMAWNDPNYIRLNAVSNYIDNLDEEDRVAIVSLGHDYDLQPFPDAWFIGPSQYTSNYLPVGWLTDDMNTTNSTEKTPHHLTNMNASGKALMNSDLNSLSAPDHPVYEDLTGGGFLVGVATNLEMAMQFAHEELIPGYIAKVTTGPPTLDIPPRFFTSDFSPGAKGDPNHQWLEILVTDGLPTAWFAGDDPANYTLDEVQCAAGNNTKIFTIGLLGAVLEPEKTQAENYLKSMANATGGTYYYADQPEDLL